MKEIAVIVLNWNGKEDTLECLQSLQEQENVDFDIIVVDNGSEEDSVKVIREEFPAVQIIESGKNLGYAEGNNVGMRYALNHGAQFVFVLNNDTVLDKLCLYYLVEDLKQHPKAAAVGPEIYYYVEPTIIYFAGGKISKTGQTFHIGIGEKDSKKYNISCETEWLTGCAILFRSEALERIGFFETSFFLLFEDTDWCLRARKSGYILRFVHRAKLWHKVSSSFGENWSLLFFYYFSRNNMLWIKRNFRVASRPFFYSCCVKRLFGTARYLSNRADKRSKKLLYYKALIRGITDFVLCRFGESKSVFN